MGKVQEIDQELATGLKQAKGKRMYFAVVLKGASDGALIVSKQKVPPKDIAEAKKESGGSTVIKGACFVEDGKYIFEVAKEPPATLPNAIKLIAKRDAGMTINPECRVGTDPDLQEEGDTGASPVATSTAPKAPPPPPPPGVSQTAKPTPQTAPKDLAQDAKKYAEALRTWEQASAAALDATDKLISALEATGDELAQAIASVIEKMRADFPDTLDDALTNLAKAAEAGNSGDTEQYRNKSEIAIKAALAFLNNNAQTIDGCEHNPFAIGVPFRAPLTEALKQVLISVKK
ncbi:MAG TPA: hypothetical protein VGY55_20045 [Pirellulales bacterium]|jgi:hypothetical protein|nr:hypothetical protein [Pirellulales bacterium]